ncbi:MAG: DegT/DnrJ/EryC1/StrS family aminotransferase, partial [Oscillospiraceae bacterium]|nr:DegT/DnrJ/EryC1/StrS family aminotransferase [Oscillospiraceae bacterium]
SLQCAFLSVKLKKLDEWNDRRRKIAAMYLDGLRDVSGILLPDSSVGESVWHQFVIRNEKRDQLRECKIEQVELQQHRRSAYNFRINRRDPAKRRNFGHSQQSDQRAEYCPEEHRNRCQRERILHTCYQEFIPVFQPEFDDILANCSKIHILPLAQTMGRSVKAPQAQSIIF